MRTAADQRERGCGPLGEAPRRHTGRRPGSQGGHFGRVHDRQQTAVAGAEQQNGALDRRQPVRSGVAGEVGVRLRRKVGIQGGRLDVKAAGRHVHAEDPRPVKLSVGMLAKGRLDRVDALAHAEQRRDVGTLEEQGFHRPVAHLFLPIGLRMKTR